MVGRDDEVKRAPSIEEHGDHMKRLQRLQRKRTGQTANEPAESCCVSGLLIIGWRGASSMIDV
jgi:hypothetical protein